PAGCHHPLAGWCGAPPPPPSPPRHREPPPPPAPTEPPPQAHAAPRATSPSGTKTSAWTSQTDMPVGSVPARESPAAAKPEGRFRIQIGMLRTEAEAQALSARVKREHPEALRAREAEIDETVVGNMGSFYRVRVGPF